jgi:hypothetical protein
MAKQLRKMPAYRAIAAFWSEELARLGKGDTAEYLARLEGRNGICFACGWADDLDRAHIVPKCEGGSDTVDNLHLLCRHCHHTSEGLPPADYWQWFCAQNQWAKIAQIRFLQQPSAAVRAMAALMQSAEGQSDFCDHPSGSSITPPKPSGVVSPELAQDFGEALGYTLGQLEQLLNGAGMTLEPPARSIWIDGPAGWRIELHCPSDSTGHQLASKRLEQG